MSSPDHRLFLLLAWLLTASIKRAAATSKGTVRVTAGLRSPAIIPLFTN